MKTRTLIFICISLVVASAILMSASCDNGVTPSMLGTWVNSDYDGGVSENGGKVVIAHVSGNDYTWTIYANHDDTVPEMTVSFTVTSETTDSGGNLIVETIAYPGDPEYIYSLSKVHADNQTLEYNASEVGYPTEIDPAGGDYGIYYRQ
jgi:hypothetical protein